MSLTLSEHDRMMDTVTGAAGGAIARDPFDHRIEDDQPGAPDEITAERTVLRVLGSVVLALGLTGLVWLAVTLLGQ